MRYCPQCGAEAKDSDTFCSKCGADLSKSLSKKPQTQDRPASTPNAIPAVALILMLVIASIAGIVLLTPAQNTSTDLHPSYSWEYMDNDYTLTLDVTRADYDRMLTSTIDKSGTVSSDLYYRTDDSGSETVFGVKNYIVVDSYVTTMVTKLTELYNGTYPEPTAEDPDLPSFIAAFVQCGIAYDATENGNDEYWKYPLETLCDKKGDCEDQSILLAALLDAAGYNAGIFVIPGHAMAAISIEDLKVYENEHFEYYPIESTGGVTLGIGYVMDSLKDAYFHLYTGNSTDYYFKSA